MHIELVHEDSQLSSLINISEIDEVLLELLDVDAEVMGSDDLHTSLSGDASNGGQCLFVKLVSIEAQVLTFSTPLFPRYGIDSGHHFIDEDYLIALLFEVRELLIGLFGLLIYVINFRWRRPLAEANNFLRNSSFFEQISQVVC